jgi:hypothetical protein
MMKILRIFLFFSYGELLDAVLYAEVQKNVVITREFFVGS